MVTFGSTRAVLVRALMDKTCERSLVSIVLLLVCAVLTGLGTAVVDALRDLGSIEECTFAAIAATAVSWCSIPPSNRLGKERMLRVHSTVRCNCLCLWHRASVSTLPGLGE